MSQVIKPFVYTGVFKCREQVDHHGFQTWVDGTAGADCYFRLAFLIVYLESEHSVCLSIQRA